ncbi:hypothetical protein [Halorubrum sp. HHNYT27]|uniref:hypothetical protein n=1 Tax=Halorubrum sp. HHNYT27 TaxID=3402275 RepID=UPI003EC06656
MASGPTTGCGTGSPARRCGSIEQADDVYWLESAELGEMVRELDGGEAALDDVTEMIRERKAAWTARKRLNPSLLLPKQIHIMGFDFDTERWMQRSGEASENVITEAGNQSRTSDGPGVRDSWS